MGAGGKTDCRNAARRRGWCGGGGVERRDAADGPRTVRRLSGVVHQIPSSSTRRGIIEDLRLLCGVPCTTYIHAHGCFVRGLGTGFIKRVLWAFFPFPRRDNRNRNRLDKRNGRHAAACAGALGGQLRWHVGHAVTSRAAAPGLLAPSLWSRFASALIPAVPKVSLMQSSRTQLSRLLLWTRCRQSSSCGGV